MAVVEDVPTAHAQGPAAAAVGGVSITVTAAGFKGTNGQAIVALYDARGTWLKVDRAFRSTRVAIGGPTVTATFADVPPGVYAASVIHDANTNGKLDMHWFPVPGPDEGAGVSNDATATFGPPSFEDARVRIGERGGVITLKLRY